LLTLTTSRQASSNLDKYVAPRTIITLESRMAASRSVLAYHELKLNNNTERLEHLKRQVELCTVRAPHDGFVIYANDDDGDTRIEEGATVRQKQDLFFLPDLSKMEVQTQLHQSVVDRVRDGQTATVRVEALPDARIEGHVQAVSPLPDTSRNWRASDEARSFLGKVLLHSIPEGLRPGMTAEVQVVTATRHDALVIPSEALTVEEGERVCYVVGPDGPMRRPVEIGEGTTELLEVRSGLAEGEEVLLDPEEIAEAVAATSQRGPAHSGVVVAGTRPPL
jgi:HlyD family secretion protein